MISEAVHPARYQFGDFELLPNQGALWRAGVRVAVTPKCMAVLIVLVDHAGRTVKKDDLLAQVWGGAAVEENNLTQTISTLRKVLGEKRGENRFIVTEPGNGYRFVAGVTRLEAPLQPPETSIASIPPSPRSISKWLLALPAVSLLCLIAAATLWLSKPAGGTTKRRSVAVLEIRNLSNNESAAWLQTALPEMLTSELASGGKLRTIPADDVVRWRSGLGNGLESTGNAGLVRLARRNFGADVFVLGSYVTAGTCPECRVRVDLGIFDAHTGESVAAIIDEGSAQGLLDLTARLGAKLRADLGIAGPPTEPPSWPAPSAMREYAEGLKALRRMDPMAARDHLQAAVNSDPGNALIHSALADAWTALGYGLRANEESRRAYELSSSLSRLDQLAIEARYRSNAQQWDRAIEIYRSIFRLFPDSLEDGLNLARAQLRAMKTADSISTLRELRRLPIPGGNDPRIDLLEAQDAGTTGNFTETRDYARRAAQEAKSRGAMYLFARARLLEGGAMQTMGEPRFDEVQAEARTVCEQLGDRQCVSSSWRIRGNHQLFSGHFQEADDAYRKGIAVAREMGDRGELANLLNGLGVVAESNLEWRQAEDHYLEAISLKKETGYNASEVQLQLADFYLRMGRLPDAARVADEAYAEAQKTNDRAEFGEIFRLRSALARLHGDLEGAQQLGEKAVTEFRATRSVAALTLALAALSSIATARGDLQGSEARLSEATRNNAPLVRLTPNPEGQGAIELARAELLLAKGQFQQAAEQGKLAAADFSNAHQHENSAKALVIEANAAETLGRKPDALLACEQAQREAAQTLDPLVLASVRLATWRLTGSRDSNEPADLHANLASLRNPELSLEEQFDLAIRARQSGFPNANRLLDALASQAANRGYFTLSRRARSLEQSGQ